MLVSRFFRDLRTPKQIADVLNTNTTTLSRWRAKKEGPPYYKIDNKILYDINTVEAYLKTKYVDTQKPARRPGQ